jgi:intracellular sulfur oxidation DsrE/DsrF family protein
MKTVNTRKTPRRAFLSSLATGAAAIGLASVTTPLVASPQNHVSTYADVDGWFDQIKGRHRAVFDVPQPHAHFPFAWARVFLLTNEKTGTPTKECSAVLVLRHNAIAFALASSMWEKYKLGEFFKVMDHKTNAPALRNAFWQPAANDFVAPGIGPVSIGINDLQADGVMVCACELAIVVQSATVAAGLKLDPEEVRKDWLAHVLPNVQLVPSGVWAIGRAQEHGCGLVHTA